MTRRTPIAHALAAVAMLAMLVLLIMAFSLGAAPALAATEGTPKPPIINPGCDGSGGACIGVGTPGSPGGSIPGPGGSGGNGGGGGSTVPLTPATNCIYTLMDPQPDKSFYAWQGHTTGSLYFKACEQTGWSVVPYAPVWMADPPAAQPAVTPRELAQKAIAALRPPVPVIHRSPSEANSDEGSPYTWVNLYTWYWADPAMWQPISKTASLDGVWATVTVAPEKLSFTPGGPAQVTPCHGSGRAWTPADGNGAPDSGGCAVRYTTAGDSVTATTSVRWSVTWKGSDGTGGTMPVLNSTSTSTFSVQQIQVVNR